MFELKKAGSTQYGIWVFGTLKFKGFEITDIFKTNFTEIPTEDFQIKKLLLKRNKDNIIRFSIEI